MFSPTVKKGHFLEINGYQPKSGTKKKIRYRLYNQDGLDLVTLAGKGMVNKTDLENASNDSFAVMTGTFDFVASVATGDRKIENKMDHIQDLQSYAISTLASGRFPADKVTPVLERIEREASELKERAKLAKARMTEKKDKPKN